MPSSRAQCPRARAPDSPAGAAKALQASGMSAIADDAAVRESARGFLLVGRKQNNACKMPYEPAIYRQCHIQFFDKFSFFVHFMSKRQKVLAL